MILENLQSQFTEEVKNHNNVNPPTTTFPMTTEGKKIQVPAFSNLNLDKENIARILGFTYNL